MRVTEAFIPKLGFAWTPEWVASGRRLALPAGKYLVTKPYRGDIPPATYAAAGVKVYSGYANPTESNALPFSQRAGWCGPHEIQAFAQAKGKLTPDLTQAECQQFPGWLMNSRDGGYAVVADEMNEAYNAQEPYGLYGYLPQRDWVDRACQEYLTPKGGIWLSGYDGHMYIQGKADSQNPNTFRSVLLGSDEGCYQYAKTCTPFASGFFSRDMWRHRHGGIKMYYDHPATHFFWQNLVNLALNRRALDFLGSSARTLAYFWPGRHEWGGHIFYRRPLPNPPGGEWQKSFVCGAPFTLELALMFFCYLLADGVWQWENTGRSGIDPAIVPPDGEEGQYVGPGNPERANGLQLYAPGRKHPYPIYPEGGTDVGYVAADWYGQCIAWVGGSQNWRFATHRSPSGGYFATENQFPLGGSYILDRALNDEGYAVRSDVVANHQWVFYYNPGLPLGQWETRTIDLGGGQNFTREFCGGVPRLFFIDYTTT